MNNLPRTVHVRLVHGRSIQYSWQGRTVRLRKGQVGMMPSELYLRYAWKLELMDADTYQHLTASMQAGEVLKHGQAAQAEAAGTQVAEPPHWELKVSPEEYWELYHDRAGQSPRVQQRLALARQLIEAGKEDE
jgi:hypothetical protein